jgi:hypothetical protein
MDLAQFHGTLVGFHLTALSVFPHVIFGFPAFST